MGSIFSKTNDNSPDSSQNTTMENLSFELSSHPHSPIKTVCRTPVNEFREQEVSSSNQLNISPDVLPATKDFENPKVILKKKLLKEFHSKLIDPRSPTIHIDRTPIVFEESNHENNNDENDMDKSINLEDTFSDLFVDKKTEDIHVASSSSSKSLLLNDDSKNEIINNKENINVKDPRSPSFDVERTPIIFSDDSNDENEMIENFLDVLNTDKMTYNENSESMLVKIIRKGIVESIYTDNTINSMMKCSTPKRNDEQQSQQQQQQNKVLSKRTPLSCMGNISHIKNKNNDKQIKPVKFNFNNLATMKHSKVEDNATPEN